MNSFFRYTFKIILITQHKPDCKKLITSYPNTVLQSFKLRKKKDIIPCCFSSMQDPHMDQNCLMCLEYRFPMPGILSIMTISQGKKKCFLELSYRIGPTLPKLGKLQTIQNVLLQFGTKLHSFSYQITIGLLGILKSISFILDYFLQSTSLEQ